MIEVLNDKSQVSKILEKHFKTYKDTNDPFEKIVIYKTKEIIGVISYSIMYGRSEINYILVLDEYLRQGFGTQLLEFALKDMIEKGVKDVSLEVAVDNEKAIIFYEKFGFKKEAIRKNYYQNKDAILMTRKLVTE